MVRIFRRFWREETGAAMIELTIAAVLLLTLVLGFVDFGNLFYQWNAANKAVQVGARLASISDPVPGQLLDETTTAPSTADVGNQVPAGSYDYVCTTTNAWATTCTCNATTLGTCPASTDVTPNAFQRIYFGDDGRCGGSVSGRPGMCDFFPALKPSEVKIEYVATGLDYWTRPGGPIPTIKVSLMNVPFKFFFLSGLLGFANITMPSMLSTVTGEDLCSGNPGSC
jgi:Flp pilus assembly protein TadG